MASAPNPEYLQTLLETFKCFICMEKIQDAHLCPHCSKLCCYSCMHRWLTEQRSQCPHCRATLHLHEIVNCRWVEDLSDQLGCLSIVDVTNVGQSRDQRCETHNERLSVFCVTCNLTICHRCALFDNSAHNDHKFQPVEDTYSEILAQLSRSCDNLKNKEDTIKKSIEQLDKNIIEIRQAKELKVREIRSAVECMMMDLEKELNIKLATLLGQKNDLLNESEQIEKFLNDCDLEVSRMPMTQLINSAPNLKKTMAKIQKKKLPILMTVCPDFHSEMIPTFEGGNLIINSFSEKLRQSKPIYSLPIGCNGVKWRLKVYPNGNGIVKDKYLSVFLELMSGPPGLSRYEYRIEMLNQHHINLAYKHVLREFTSNFEIGECWGYNRFFRLDLLRNEGFLERDTLFFKFSVRPPTYYQKCREQQWYLSKLELETCIIFDQLESSNEEEIPAKVKPIDKKVQSPDKKRKIEIQSLLDEFECTEAIEKPVAIFNEDQRISSENASKPLLQPSLSLQTMNDNEFQNRFQDETAQSMLERLSRIFEETDNPNKSCTSPLCENSVTCDSPNNISELIECITVNPSVSEWNRTMSQNERNLSHLTLTNHGLHNPMLPTNERFVNNVSQETSSSSESNRFLDLEEHNLFASIFTDSHYTHDWVINRNVLNDDEHNPNESMAPDHLTKDE